MADNKVLSEETWGKVKKLLRDSGSGVMNGPFGNTVVTQNDIKIVQCTSSEGEKRDCLIYLFDPQNIEEMTLIEESDAKLTTLDGTGSGLVADEFYFAYQSGYDADEDGDLLFIAMLQGASSIMGLLYEKSIGDWIEYTFVQVLDGSPVLTYSGGSIGGIAYSEQNIDLPIAPSGSDGPRFPDTATTDSSEGNVSWTNPTNVTASDNTYATCDVPTTQESRYLLASDFDFALPTDAIILSVQVNIECKSSGADVSDVDVRLATGATLMEKNKASNTSLGTSDGTLTYTFTPTEWGIDSAAATFNATDFGVAVRFKNNALATRTVSVDGITVTLDYAIAVKDCIVRLRQGQGDYWLIDFEPKWEIVKADPDADPVDIGGVFYQPGWLMRYDQASRDLFILEDILILDLGNA